MIHFLHTYEPRRTLATIAGIEITWYGVLMLLAVCVGFFLTRNGARRHGITTTAWLDCTVILFLAGIVGARLWYVLCIEPRYFLAHPLHAFAIWEGGIAFHGGIIGALVALRIWTHRTQNSFLTMTDILVPALAIGQAIGRWGNYFNRELYGSPTTLPWGMPMAVTDAVSGLTVRLFVHPTFLYESLALFGIGLALIILHRISTRAGIVTGVYLIATATVRFFLEFLRVDPTPTLFLRLPQWVSLVVIIIGVALLLSSHRKYSSETSARG